MFSPETNGTVLFSSKIGIAGYIYNGVISDIYGIGPAQGVI